jgi:hypothetical protein
LGMPELLVFSSTRDVSFRLWLMGREEMPVLPASSSAATGEHIGDKAYVVDVIVAHLGKYLTSVWVETTVMY